MARTRRRSSYRKSKRWNPKARHSKARGRGRSRRRNCMNPAAKAGYSGISRAKFRKKTIWKMARRGKRTFKHLNPRGRKGRRRNPSGSQLRDGSTISISGSDVTLYSPYGESYEYSDVSPSAIRKLRRASSFSQASRICDSAGVSRSINPRGGRKSRRKGRTSRRSSSKAQGRKSSRSKRGRRSYARR